MLNFELLPKVSHVQYVLQYAVVVYPIIVSRTQV